MSPRKRHRTGSGGSIRSVESMSIGSGSESGEEGPAIPDPTISIVTNASFLRNVRMDATRCSAEKCSSVSPYSVSNSEVTKYSSECASASPSSISNSEVSPSPATSSPHHASVKSPSSSSSSASCVVTFDIAKMLHNLGITTLPEGNQNLWFSRLCPLISDVLRRTSPRDVTSLQEKIKKHVFQRSNGELLVTLVGASLLRLHPDLEEKRLKKGDALPKYLPSPIREKLYYGTAVPVRHILYSEALIEGTVVHHKDGRAATPNPYPLNLIRDQPPLEFVLNIRRPDLIRGITTHSLTVGSRFPRLAANMHNLLREIWVFLYQDMMDVQVVMDIYDEYFKQFERQLCLLSLMSMDHFPPDLVTNVKAKYTCSRVSN